MADRAHVLCLFLDGFGYDYVRERITPFLYAVSRRGVYRPLKTVIGFSSSIKPTIWTGRMPRIHGCFTYWGFVQGAEHKSPKLYSIFRHLPTTKLRVIGREAAMYLLLKMGSSAVDWFLPAIPDNIMPFFSRLTPEVTSDTEINGVRTVFSILDNHHIRYTWSDTTDYSFPELHMAEESTFDVIFIPNFDGLGHAYGPRSTRIRVELRKLDSFVEKIVRTYGASRDFHLLMFSDHGMVERKDRVDVRGEISRLPFVQPRDYLAFYDHTMVRFWFFSDRADKVVRRKLEAIRYGRILSKEDKERYGIDFGHNRYGDLIFLLEPGFEVFPNYFAAWLPRCLERALRPSSGLHGYDPDHRSQLAAFMYYGESSRLRALNELKYLNAVDIMPVILTVYGINLRSYCESDLMSHIV